MRTLIFLFVVLNITSCTNKSTPSAEAFESAINSMLKSAMVCETWSYPYDWNPKYFLSSLGPADADKRRQIEEAQKQNKTAFAHSFFGFGEKVSYLHNFFSAVESGGLLIGRWTVRGISNSDVAILNEKGLAFFTPVPKSKTTSTSQGVICYAEQKVNKVVGWTEPAEMFGKRITEVEYSIQLHNVAGWAKRLVAQQKQGTQTITLVLTNEGWRVPEETIQKRPFAPRPTVAAK